MIIKLGTVALLLAVGFFIWFGLARTFSDIWPFGVGLAIIGIALGISWIIKRKKYGK